jgi:hypothetical protein
MVFKIFRLKTPARNDRKHPGYKPPDSSLENKKPVSDKQAPEFIRGVNASI